MQKWEKYVSDIEFIYLKNKNNITQYLIDVDEYIKNQNLTHTHDEYDNVDFLHNVMEIHNWIKDFEINKIINLLLIKYNISDEIIEIIKNIEQEPQKIIHLISLNPQYLLTKNNPENTILYLILHYYPPFKKNNLMLKNQFQDLYVICYNEVSKYHFDMLLYLMKKDCFRNEFNVLLNNNELSHLLLENYIDNIGTTNTAKYNWKALNNTVIYEKIRELKKHGFTLADINERREEKMYYPLIGLSDWAKNTMKIMDKEELEIILEHPPKNINTSF